MVHYKLTYFNLRGFCEPARQVLALADVEFEDVRFEHGDGTWEKLKPDTPFGHVPVLEVDGFKIPQSAAITRYLARKFGYAGKTAEEEAWVDALVDQYKDYVNQFRQHLIAKHQGKSDEEVEKIRKEVGVPAVEGFLAIVKARLEKSKSGFLVGDSVTFADLTIADHLLTLQKLGFADFAGEPKLTEFQNKVNSIPALKAWIEKRPDTPF